MKQLRVIENKWENKNNTGLRIASAWIVLKRPMITQLGRGVSLGGDRVICINPGWCHYQWCQSHLNRMSENRKPKQSLKCKEISKFPRGIARMVWSFE